MTLDPLGPGHTHTHTPVQGDSDNHSIRLLFSWEALPLPSSPGRAGAQVLKGSNVPTETRA